MSAGKIIDKTAAEFDDVPHSLEGEVLIERTVDANGNPSGFLTCPLDTFIAMKNASAAERAAGGWDRHAAMLDAADPAALRTSLASIAARRAQA